MAKHDVRTRLAELAAIPTLVLSAVEDRIAPPAAGLDTASRIPGARHVVLADAAHGVTISHPVEVDAMLDEHFRSAG